MPIQVFSKKLSFEIVDDPVSAAAIVNIIKPVAVGQIPKLETHFQTLPAKGTHPGAVHDSFVRSVEKNPPTPPISADPSAFNFVTKARSSIYLPVPDSGTLCGASSPLSLTVKSPVCGVVLDGLNVTFTSQV